MAEPATAAGVTAAYNRDAVQARAAGEPDWLAEGRLAAWDTYETTPLPTTRLEEWRYTDPRKLKWDGVKLAGSRALPAAAAGEVSNGAASGRVIQAGGAISAIELDPDLAARGVLLLDLREAGLSLGIGCRCSDQVPGLGGELVDLGGQISHARLGLRIHLLGQLIDGR